MTSSTYQLDPLEHRRKQMKGITRGTECGNHSFFPRTIRDWNSMAPSPDQDPLYPLTAQDQSLEPDSLLFKSLLPTNSHTTFVLSSFSLPLLPPSPQPSKVTEWSNFLSVVTYKKKKALVMMITKWTDDDDKRMMVNFIKEAVVDHCFFLLKLDPN